MKLAGIIRNMDGLGRVVIPKEIRKNMGITEHDPIEFYIEGNRIILQKHVEQSCCPTCGCKKKK